MNLHRCASIERKTSILRNIGGNSIKFMLQILTLCEKFGKKVFFEVRDFLLTNSNSADPETNDVNRKIHFSVPCLVSDSADRAGAGGPGRSWRLTRWHRPRLAVEKNNWAVGDDSNQSSDLFICFATFWYLWRLTSCFDLNSTIYALSSSL